jgi:hypothetical protein
MRSNLFQSGIICANERLSNPTQKRRNSIDVRLSVSSCRCDPIGCQFETLGAWTRHKKNAGHAPGVLKELESGSVVLAAAAQHDGEQRQAATDQSKAAGLGNGGDFQACDVEA